MTEPTNKPIHIVFAGGGTGGHLIPALVVADEIRRRHPDARLSFLTTGKAIESQVLATSPVDVIAISAPMFPRILGYPKFGWQFLVATLRCRKLLKQLDADLVFGLGGYGSMPVGIAANTLSLPIALIEINTHCGKANRVLGKIAKKIFLQFEEAKQYFKNKSDNVVISGCPVRADLKHGSREQALEQFGLKDDRKTLVILGGSQGATAINDLISASVAIADFFENLQILHLCGPNKSQGLTQAYQNAQVPHCVMEYCDDMAAAYAVADLVISRAGASTVAELAALQKPCILIPFPHATDDHQRKNAKILVDAQLGTVLIEKELSAQTLVEQIKLGLSTAIPEPNHSQQLPEQTITDHLLELINKP